MMEAFLRLGGTFCWTVAIASETIIQWWPARKKLLNIMALCFFALALSADFGSYWYEELPEIEWFQATDGNNETFALSKVPLSGSEEILINGLLEHGSDVYRIHGKTVTISTPLSRTDQITIKYRHYR